MSKFDSIVTVSILFIYMIMCAFMVKVSENNEIEGESKTVVYESKEENNDHNTIIPPATALPNEVSEVEEVSVEENTYSRNLSEEDKYLLAKIAMAEAEGESLETKVLVILTILNRVESDKRYFPDTIKEVIFQSSNGVYQFSPVMEGGRWWTTEPNKECWEAVNIVNASEYDISQGALYFEACKNENNWHSRNLEFICQSDNTRFYK